LACSWYPCRQLHKYESAVLVHVWSHPPFSYRHSSSATHIHVYKKCTVCCTRSAANSAHVISCVHPYIRPSVSRLAKYMQNYSFGIKLCPRGAQTCVLLLFCDRDLEINPMTLNEVGRSSHSKYTARIEKVRKLLKVKCHQLPNTADASPWDIFLPSYINFLYLSRFFEILCGQTDAQKDRHRQKQYLLAA